MAKGLGIHFAAAVGLFVMGVSLPAILPVLLAIGVGRTILSAKSRANQIRDEVAKEPGASA